MELPDGCSGVLAEGWGVAGRDKLLDPELEMKTQESGISEANRHIQADALITLRFVAGGRPQGPSRPWRHTRGPVSN